MVPVLLHLDEVDSFDLLEDVSGLFVDLGVSSEVAGVVVGDSCLELVVEGEPLLLDELVNVLGEVVDVLSGLGVVVSDVAGDGLVTSGTGHDHVVCTDSVSLGDGLDGEVHGEVLDTDPEERG